MIREEALKLWFDEEIEQDVYDATGGDWDDMLALVKDTFRSGWDAALATMGKYKLKELQLKG